MKAIKINTGIAEVIENDNRKGNEAESYVRIWIEDADGTNQRPVFLTKREFDAVEKRTQKHREDWIERGWIIEFK